jgi:hypothetical protein
MPTKSNCTTGFRNLGGILLLLSMAIQANALEPWKCFEPNRPDWVEAGSSPRAKFFIDQNEMQIDGAVVWAFEQAVYAPGVKFFNPDKVAADPKYSGSIKRAVFLLEFLCEHNTYREVNTTYWYENGEHWDSGYPNLLAHGQIDIDNPIFQYMANFACAKRKAAATAVPTIAATASPERLSAAMPAELVSRGTLPNAAQPSAAGANTVQNFYSALGRGDGVTANSLMVLEKRASPAYQPDAIEAFYGHMVEPVTLVSVSASGSGDYEVRYRYRKQTAICNGHAVVTTQESGGRTLIARIKTIGNC